MNSGRAKIIVLAVFLLTLGAGMTAGILAARLPGGPASIAPTSNVGDGSPLVQELGLTPDQSKQMQKIWEGVRDLSADSEARAAAANDVRMNAIRALIPSDKISDFNGIMRKYDETVAGMKGQRQAAFADAVARTRKLLDDEQRKKYDEILKNRLGTEEVNEHDPLAEPASGRAVSQPAS